MRSARLQPNRRSKACHLRSRPRPISRLRSNPTSPIAKPFGSLIRTRPSCVTRSLFCATRYPQSLPPHGLQRFVASGRVRQRTWAKVSYKRPTSARSCSFRRGRATSSVAPYRTTVRRAANSSRQAPLNSRRRSNESPSALTSSRSSGKLLSGSA